MMQIMKMFGVKKSPAQLQLSGIRKSAVVGRGTFGGMKKYPINIETGYADYLKNPRLKKPIYPSEPRR